MISEPQGGRGNPGSPPRKLCRGCIDYKPVWDFWRDKNKRDGRHTRCKACMTSARASNRQKEQEAAKIRRATNRKYYEQHGAPRIARTKKRCSGCRLTKLAKEFYTKKTEVDGLRSCCKECERLENVQQSEQRQEAHRRWREKNPEKWAACIRRWRAANLESWRAVRAARLARERAVSGDGFTGRQWEAVLDFYGHRCLCCGSVEKITIDHVVPLSRGGRNDLTNLQPLCGSCNSRKYTKTIDYRDPYLQSELLEAMRAEGLLAV